MKKVRRFGESKSLDILNNNNKRRIKKDKSEQLLINYYKVRYLRTRTTYLSMHTYVAYTICMKLFDE